MFNLNDDIFNFNTKNENINIEDIRKFKHHPEMIGIKYYPKNVTTNSQNGINNIKNIFFILFVLLNRLVIIFILINFV